MLWNVFFQQWDTSKIALILSSGSFKDILKSNHNFWAENFLKTLYISNNFENIKHQIGYELKSQGIRAAFLISHDIDINTFVINALSEKFMIG